jgi:type IV pilus assembly protein PilB
MEENPLSGIVIDPEEELATARRAAERYCFEFVDLRDLRPDPDVLRSIPLDVMLDYQFLPIEARNGELSIAVGDPSNLARLDELAMRLDRQLVVKVAAPSQVREFLSKTDPSQRVLDEATVEFRLDVIREEENGHGHEDLSLEQLVGEHNVSPVIRLVDSIERDQPHQGDGRPRYC